MKIKGIQKLTLIDYPGKIACTLFLFGCNFRCGFCHNPELVLNPTGKDFSEEEFLEFLEKRKNQIEGVCITGGEPLLTLEKSFVQKIKDLGYAIKIDTNGSFPERLKEFVDEGLVDFVAMDLKGARENYSKIVNAIIDIGKIEKSIKLIMNSGIDYEFRTTVVKRFHDKDELKKMFDWVLGLSEDKILKNYSLQGFVNKGKLVDEDFRREENVHEKDLLPLKKIAEDYFENVEIKV